MSYPITCPVKMNCSKSVPSELFVGNKGNKSFLDDPGVSALIGECWSELEKRERTFAQRLVFDKKKKIWIFVEVSTEGNLSHLQPELRVPLTHIYVLAFDTKDLPQIQKQLPNVYPSIDHFFQNAVLRGDKKDSQSD